MLLTVCILGASSYETRRANDTASILVHITFFALYNGRPPVVESISKGPLERLLFFGNSSYFLVEERKNHDKKGVREDLGLKKKKKVVT